MIYGERGVITYVGDLIMCGMCGHTCKRLAPHLKAAHGMTCREYKVEMSLPVTSALISKSLRAYLSRTSIFNDPKQNTGRFVASEMGLTPSVCARKSVDARVELRRDPVYRSLHAVPVPRRVRLCVICDLEFYSVHKKLTCSHGCHMERQKRAHVGQVGWSKGKKLPPLTASCREKIGKVHRGVPKSAEHKAKIAQGLARYWDSQKDGYVTH